MEWCYEWVVVGFEFCLLLFCNLNLVLLINLLFVLLFVLLYVCCCFLIYLFNFYFILLGILILLLIVVWDEEGLGGVGVCVFLLCLMCLWLVRLIFCVLLGNLCCECLLMVELSVLGFEVLGFEEMCESCVFGKSGEFVCV